MKNFRNVLWGIVLIAVGIIIGANALGIADIDIFFDGWWTLFIIVPCFIGLFNEREKTGNIIGIIIGAALLLSCQGILNFDMIWKLALPVILIIIGLSFIFRDTFNKEVSDAIKRLNAGRPGESEYFATFSGQNVNFDREEFKAASLNAVFGGVKCDLTGAIINEDCVVNCSAVFGGITVYAPDDVKIKIKSSSIFGGVSNTKKPSVNENENEKTLYINATCIFGGVEIK